MLILLAGTKEILYAIEDNASGRFKPAIIGNTIDQNWQQIVGPEDTERYYALTPKLPDTVYAGAPYLRQLHSGQTILSYQSAQNRGNNSNMVCMKVAVGDSNGRKFINMSQPFNVPVNKYGLWNSLCVPDDDTITAVTSMLTATMLFG